MNWNEFGRVANYWWFMLANLLIALVVYASYTAYDNRRMVEWNTKRIDDLIEARTRDRWTATDSRVWLDEFRRLNPTLNVPEPKAEFEENGEQE